MMVNFWLDVIILQLMILFEMNLEFDFSEEGFCAELAVEFLDVI
jgi:hypothetical protein